MNYLIIFICSIMLFLFNFQQVVMFFGFAGFYLKWACLFAIILISFKKIVKV